MGLRGPQPTPTSILQMRGSLKGTYGRVGEPQSPVEAPAIPAILGAEGKAEWERIVPLLIARRTLAKTDRAMLTVYCQAWEDFTAATILVAKARAGKYKHKGALQDHPRRVLYHAVDRLLKTAAQFGLSPSTKARVRAEGNAPQEDEDPRRRFFPTGPALRSDQTAG